MEKIKKPSVAGQFYTADEQTLRRQLTDFAAKTQRDCDATSRLVIAPHAGYVYSGECMSRSIAYLPADGIKNVFIIAPSHHASFTGLALSSFDRWQTPLGTVEVNGEINRLLRSDFACSFLDEAFAPEHAAEVEVPFIQYHYPQGVRIVPILVGQVIPEKIAHVLRSFYPDPENAFVISSDLSHFLTSRQARKIDSRTADMIETGNVAGFHWEQACGAMGILGSVLFANDVKSSFIRAGMCNSGDVTGDQDRVVGYGSWFLYEGTKEEYLKRFYSEYILSTVRRAIRAGLERRDRLNRSEIPSYMPVFDQKGACFVTLEINHALRGCIGTIEAHDRLIDDLLSNSWNAAFGDPRFRPLTHDEFEQTRISVSLLETPKPLTFNSEKEMLDQITPFEHGVIISDLSRRAVYLPSVWKQLPDKDSFMKNLKHKAGLPIDHFSNTFQAWVFRAAYIEEKHADST
ncbi:MAG: AmmeMemoRadiSam system protein B [Thermoguttaceae bacterium]|nr:AmmeMemoRadiSam system protein B [Thermoguttaceae bacterium]